MSVPQSANSVAPAVNGATVASRAPSAAQFPAYPASWYLFATSRELRKGVVSKSFWGTRLVGYRTSNGTIAVLDGNCCHLGADLGSGRVIGDSIECPFHNWRFGPDGRCRQIPAQEVIPDFARQMSYPAVERHGLIFVFRGAKPNFDLPFFPGCNPDDLTPARPFSHVLKCPWYMIGANAFDQQHFRAAHDRRMTGEPVIECPASFARRATVPFSVCSDSFRDHLIRRFAGDRVELSITDWCGTLLFTTATFRRTRSYGMVAVQPLENGQVCVTITVFVPRGKHVLGRCVLTPLSKSIRRNFIREFTRSDADRLNGARYNPSSLIEADSIMAAYFRWLSVVSHGTPWSEEKT